MYKLVLFGLMLAIASCTAQDKGIVSKKENKMNFEIYKSENDWKKSLTPEAYSVLRDKSTERPFSGKFNLYFEDGNYTCMACGNVLFKSDDKFKSECGWPSFSDVADKSAIKEVPDTTHGMIRTEVVCAKCGGHLGHIFNDGPTPNGLRYCINSVSLDFKKDEEKK